MSKRRTSSVCRVALSVVAILVGAGVARANLITDGSFEDVSSVVVGRGQNSELGTHNYRGSEWGNTDILNQWDKVHTRTWIMTDGTDNEFPDGSIAVRLDGQQRYNARLFQTGIAMTANKEYELSLSVWGEGGSPGIGAQFVGETSGDVITAFNGPTTSTTDGVAEVKTVKFTPTSTEDYTIELYATNGSHTWIDAVQLDPVGPQIHYIGGDNNIGTETLDGTQSNEVINPNPVINVRTVEIFDAEPGDTLNIREVRAFEVGTGENEAHTTRGATASGPSGWGGDPVHAIEDANVDSGTPAGGCCGEVWHSSGDGQTLTINLNEDVDLEKVEIWGRDDCCWDRQANIRLRLLDVGSNVLHESFHDASVSPYLSEIEFADLASADLTASLNPFDFGAGYTYVFELGSADMIEVGNPNPGVFTTFLDLNNADIEIEWLTGSAPADIAAGDVFDLLDADFLTGGFNNYIPGTSVDDLPLLPTGLAWDDSMFLTDGTLTVVNAIPEPMTMLAVGLGITSLGGYIRRRKRA